MKKGWDFTDIIMQKQQQHQPQLQTKNKYKIK